MKKNKIIAFDLDNTLIRCEFDFPVEQPQKGLFAKILKHEKLRLGTSEIFNFCQKFGWETWIYTTSFRIPFYIKKLFWLYDIKVQGIINQTKHQKSAILFSSKYPPAFGIDILVDDSIGVKMEGEKFGFEVLQIDPKDENWTEKVKTKINSK